MPLPFRQSQRQPLLTLMITLTLRRRCSPLRWLMPMMPLTALPPGRFSPFSMMPAIIFDTLIAFMLIFLCHAARFHADIAATPPMPPLMMPPP
jgi:hypothetical protein